MSSDREPNAAESTAVVESPEAEAPVLVEITDVLDLHSFLPREVASVVRDYLDEAARLGLHELRIIHGRGIGVQRKTVRKILERDERVGHFCDAPPEAGGRGATLIRLR